MYKKRFVITIGDARVGKSTISRLMLELYHKNSKSPKVYYHGNRNKLSMYESNDFKIPLLGFSRGESDILLMHLENNKAVDLVFTDMPGQNLPQFKYFEKDVSLIKNLNLLGYRVTFLHPISHRKDCVKEYLEDLCDTYGISVDYVIVKNQYFGDEFTYYDDQPIQEAVKNLNGVELHLKPLYDSYYQKLDDTGLTYGEAISVNSPLYVLERSLIFHWVESFHSEVLCNEQAFKYLGLEKSEEIADSSEQSKRRVKW